MDISGVTLEYLEQIKRQFRTLDKGLADQLKGQEGSDW